MGSPLGPTFANFYVGNLENKTLNENPSLKPEMYSRYVDDIFIVVNNEDQIKNLKSKLEQNSKLKFTYELNINNKLPFLDVLVDNNNESITTKVYRKPTDKGRCLNASSQCPERYKTSVIRYNIRRAHKLCSSWQSFHEEIQNSKQILINNGYSNTNFDEELNKYLEQQNKNRSETPCKTKISLYYQNQMNTGYKIDERILKNMIKKNVQCTNNDDQIELRIYYKNKKTSNLLMKNNLHSNTDLKSTNVIYKFTCPDRECLLSPCNKYIGLTTTTLSRRLTMHLYNGAIKKHLNDEHNTTVSRSILVDNTEIVNRVNDVNRLQLTEALLIKTTKPSINIQDTGFCRTLKLFSE